MIDQLSIRARFVVGVLTFARYCDLHHLHDLELDAFIEHGFALATATDIPAWERHEPALVLVGLGYDYPDEFVPQDEDQRVILTSWLQQVTEIAYADLYGATTQASKQHLLAALAIAEEHGVQPPDLTAFLDSRWDQAGGWGEPVSPQVVTQWRALRFRTPPPPHRG
ncbi:hypothetical protein [Deinococcus sonorensis]|uniref:Uncharacterized protein n=1 Tax=Deinococcus sonorensis TaxID=309891 RepID=A0ABV8YBI5_9DEIO